MWEIRGPEAKVLLPVVGVVIGRVTDVEVAVIKQVVLPPSHVLKIIQIESPWSGITVK